MKFRVHTFQVYRVSYEIEAESAEDAQSRVSAHGWEMNPCERPEHADEWMPDYIVDPILPNGEVDYDNTRFFNEDEMEKEEVNYVAK